MSALAQQVDFSGDSPLTQLKKIIVDDTLSQRPIVLPAGASQQARQAALEALNQEHDVRKKVYQALVAAGVRADATGAASFSPRVPSNAMIGTRVALQAIWLANISSMQSTTVNTLTDAEIAAYEAPFPSFIYMAGPRTLPSMNVGLVGQQLSAWESLKKFEK